MGLLDRLDALDRRFGADPKNPRPLTKKFALIVVAIYAAVGAIPLVATVWNRHHDEQVAARLRRGGAVVDVQVVDVRHGGRLRAVAGEAAKVVFRTEAGQQVTTWITVRSAPDTGPTRFRYLRSTPSMARLVDDPVPRRGISGPLAAGAFRLGTAAWGAHLAQKGLHWEAPQGRGPA